MVVNWFTGDGLFLQPSIISKLAGIQIKCTSGRSLPGLQYSSLQQMLKDTMCDITELFEGLFLDWQKYFRKKQISYGSPDIMTALG